MPANVRNYLELTEAEDYPANQRVLLVTGLPPNTTNEDIKQLYRGSLERLSPFPRTKRSQPNSSWLPLNLCRHGR